MVFSASAMVLFLGAAHAQPSAGPSYSLIAESPNAQSSVGPGPSAGPGGFEAAHPSAFPGGSTTASAQFEDAHPSADLGHSTTSPAQFSSGDSAFVQPSEGPGGFGLCTNVDMFLGDATLDGPYCYFDSLPTDLSVCCSAGGRWQDGECRAVGREMGLDQARCEALGGIFSAGNDTCQESFANGVNCEDADLISRQAQRCCQDMNHFCMQSTPCADVDRWTPWLVTRVTCSLPGGRETCCAMEGAFWTPHDEENLNECSQGYCTLSLHGPMADGDYPDLVDQCVAAGGAVVGSAHTCEDAVHGAMPLLSQRLTRANCSMRFSEWEDDTIAERVGQDDFRVCCSARSAEEFSTALLCDGIVPAILTNPVPGIANGCDATPTTSSTSTTIFSALSNTTSTATFLALTMNSSSTVNSTSTMPSSSTTTTTSTATSSMPFGYIITGSLTLSVSAVGNLGNEASMDAMKAAIAEQAGVDIADVASVEISFKVIGAMPLVVSDPMAFVASDNAALGIAMVIAAQNNIPVSHVMAVLSVIRRLQGRRVQSGSNVNVLFEIAVAAAGAAADRMTETMLNVSSTTLAAAINTELNDTDLEVTSVDEVTAAPEVSVSFMIVTTDDNVAKTAEVALANADPTEMTESLNERLQNAGIQVEVTVTEISAPTIQLEGWILLEQEGEGDDESNSFQVGVIVAAIVGAVCVCFCAAVFLGNRLRHKFGYKRQVYEPRADL